MRLCNRCASHFHLLAGGVQLIISTPHFESSSVGGHFLCGGYLLLHCSLMGKPSPLGSAIEEIELDLDSGQPVIPTAPCNECWVVGLPPRKRVHSWPE